MAVLSYDIKVVGAKNVESALASIEKRFVQHNRQIVGQAARTANAPGLRSAARRSGGGADPMRRDLADMAKGYNAIARAGMTAERSLYREKERLRKREETEQIRSADRARRAFRSSVGSGLSSVGRNVAGMGKAALAVTGLGGGALVASRLGSAMNLEKSSRAIELQGRQNGQASPLSAAQIQKQTSDVAISTGANIEDVSAGFAKFVSKTGDVKGASDNLKVFATVAQAAGASVEDVASAAAALSSNMDIKTTEDMSQALATIYYQGKKGAFELKDMAGYLSNIAAEASSLGIKGGAGMRTLGGLTQIAMTGTGDAAVAATATKDMLAQLVAKGKDLQSGKALGGKKVSVFTDKGMHNVGDVRSILADTIARGNAPQLEEIFGRRGMGAINPLVATANAARSAAGGGAAGEAAARKAVLASIEDSADAAGKFSDVQSDATETLKNASTQLEILNSKLVQITSGPLLDSLKKLGPPAERLIPLITQAADKFAELLDWIADNPFRHIGDLVAAKVVFDIGRAAIGDKIKTTLVDLLTASHTGGGGISIPGGGGGTTQGGKKSPLALIGAATQVGAIGLAAYEAGTTAGDLAAGQFDTKDAIQTQLDLANGTLSDPAEIAKRRAGLQASLSEAQQGPGVMASVFGGVSKVLGGQSASEANQAKIDAMNAAIAKLTAALDKNTAATSSGGSTALNRGNSPSPIKG